MDWIIDRLREPSTWRGLTALLTVAGIALTPEQTAAITAACIAVVALIEVFRSEHK